MIQVLHYSVHDPQSRRKKLTKSQCRVTASVQEATHEPSRCCRNDWGRNGDSHEEQVPGSLLRAASASCPTVHKSEPPSPKVRASKSKSILTCWLEHSLWYSLKEPYLVKCCLVSWVSLSQETHASSAVPKEGSFACLCFASGLLAQCVFMTSLQQEELMTFLRHRVHGFYISGPCRPREWKTKNTLR